MVGAVLVLMGVGVLLASLLCIVLLRVSERAGWLDATGFEAHKLHDHAVPNTGGIALFFAISLPMLAIFTAVWCVPDTVWPGTLAVHAPGLRDMTATGLWVLAAISALHVLGIVDDRKTLGPWSKLAIQLIVAAVLAIAADMRVLQLLDPLGLAGYLASASLSVIWIVIIINAFNFLDNMDGLSGGVALIIAGLYLIITLAGGQWFVAGLCALLIGALLAFLWFNLSPAKLFMGDGGSLVIGVLLAIISIRTTYYDSLGDRGATYAMLMPVVMMAVPLYDFVSVVVLRAMRGQNPLRGDHNHFSHRLVRLGLSRRRAVGVIWLCTLATGMSGMLLGSLSPSMAVVAAIQAMAILAVLAVLESGVNR